MLEWVEGKLSRIEEANRAASTRAGVGDRVRQMQANRRALQSLGDVRAPAELMDRVLVALEREALLGLTNGEDVSDHPPISIATHQVTVRRNSNLQKWAPQLALAAGLLLLVGGAAYWGSTLIKPAPKGGVVANNDATPVVPPPDLGDAATLKESQRLATAGSEATSLAPPDESPVTTAMAAPDEEMTDERILRLAREGRLVMRVKARDFSRLAQVEAMDTLKDGRTWRVSKDVPQEVAVAVAQPTRTDPMTEPHDAQPTIASVAPFIASGALGFPVPPGIELPQVTTRTYLIDFPDTQKTLAAIKATLSDRLRATIEFEELETPVALPRMVDPDALLWWTLPPSSWTQRVTVPVVVR
jgi:hypothetical protein